MIADPTYTLADLTQGIAEALVDALPDGDIPAIRYQSAFLNAAIVSGWLILDPPPPSVTALPRRFAAKLYGELTRLWREANEIPNA